MGPYRRALDFARLRNRRFFSAADLNVAIGELVGDINARVMKGYDASRVEPFAAIDKPALKPLPGEPYAFAVWKRCRVAPDYHIEIDGHGYSAPFRLIKELVDARVADKTVEIFHKGQRVASHLRAPEPARPYDDRRTHAEREQRDLLEILEDRHQRASTIVTSQVPVEQWCEIIGNPTRADAILDRLVHNALRRPMTGKAAKAIS